MELKELKCKNCGANLQVEENAKEVNCKFCHTTFAVETAENTGYEFEKGRIKAQKEEFQNKMKDVSDAVKNVNINADEVAKTMKWPFIIFAIIFVIMFIGVGFFIVSVAFGMNKGIKSSSDKFAVSAFNTGYEMDTGTQPYIFVENTLSDVITDNKKGKHIITVVYNDTKTSKPDEIKELKNSLDKSKQYEISFDYDDKGFINKMIIEDV